MHNVILIGMPGVGKSTLGVLLAKTLGMTFLDTDLVIQDQKKALLRELIAQHGIDGFLALEGTVCAGLQAENAVIATGGSVVYGKEAMQHLREIGTVVYLKVSYDILEKRLHDIKGRGVVLKDGQDLRGLYEERVPLYEKYADITVCEDNLNVEQTIEKITEQLNKLEA